MRNNLATFVEDFQRHGDQIAIVSYSGNRRIRTSYAELATLAGRFSRLFAERNINSGDRVLLWGANSAEWIAAFFGCVLRGIIAVPLDAAGSAEFAARVLAEVSPRLIVGDPDLLAKLSVDTPKFSFRDPLPREPLLTPDPSLDRETTLQILYTSGTTSAPKGIVHSHGNVLSSVEVLEREMRKYLRYERWVHPLRFLHTLPLSHVFGQFMGLWVPQLLAAEVHYEDKLVAGHIIDRIHRQRISVAIVVPRVLELMRASLLASDPELQSRINKFQQERIWWRWWHLRGLHHRFGFKFWAFVSGGATLPEEIEQFWNALGFVLVQGYGMTETTALATLNHPFHTSRGSIGKPLAGREVRVSPDGEILVRGANLAAGTWRNGHMEPRQEEWLHTGDLGSVDAAGDVRFLGRKSDVIVAASGMNIHPADLEEVVRRQSGVRDCMVVGWNGPRGPEPVASVILDASSDGNDRALEQILTNANRELQEFQQLRTVLRWPANEFPRNSTGKLLRREVAAWVQLQTTTAIVGLTASQDPLLQLLQQVTGESAEGLDDSADLGTALHLDSLARMQLAMGMEEKFGTTVRDESIAQAKTLGDLRKISRQGGIRSGAVRSRVESSIDATPANLQPLEPPGDASEQTVPVPKPNEAGEQKLSPKYVRWPWCVPVQAARVAFIESVLRPLVAAFAPPRVLWETKELPQQPSIYVCNHVAVIDVALVLFALPPRVRRHMAIAMSAEMLAAWRRARDASGVGAGPLRWLAPLQAQAVSALLNVFPLPAAAGLRQSFAHAGEALDQGYNLLVFPEGRRTRTGDLQAFQTGISLLAQESQTAIVPMALAGLWQAAQRPGLSKIRPPGLTVVIGAPMQQASGESHWEFAVRLRSAVEHLISLGDADASDFARS